MPAPSLGELGGLARSLAIYRSRPLRTRARRNLYRAFVAPGDLCFDIGAHAGNHTESWLGLGARVVALEPQPQFMRLLRRLYGERKDVILLEEAVGAEPGEATLFISSRTPTVTSLSRDWIASVGKTPSFRRVDWDRTAEVRVTTLDALIARFGEPAFCKIDVEGLEAEVLHGLSQPLRGLSFEVLPAAREVAQVCLARLAELGPYRFNVSVGESFRFLFPEWRDAAALRDWLDRLRPKDRSGDIYCRLAPPP